MLGIFKPSRLCKNKIGSCCIILRYSSSKLEQKITPKPSFQRRFVRPESFQSNRILPDKFVWNIFQGNFDKNIFNYPASIKQENVDLILKHCFEIEKFIQNHFTANTTLNKDLARKFSGVEAFGLSLPINYGGSGYSEAEIMFVQECAAINFNAAKFLVNNDIGCKIINNFGSTIQKEKYLHDLARGEKFITLAYLENSPLIDIPSIEATAVYNTSNDCFILNGYKKLVHHANVSDLILVFAKTTMFDEFEESLKYNYQMFIVEKNMPGVTVNQLKSKCAKDLDLFEICLQNVQVPKENMIPSENSASIILKSSVSFSELGTAVICLSFCKKLVSLLVNGSEDIVVMNKPFKECEFVKTSLGHLCSFVYALESLLYFVSGRYDKFKENSDMFYECVIAKVFAVITLELAINKYIQLLGTHSFKSNESLEEACNVLQYAKSVNESTLHLKLMLGTEGVLEASRSLTSTVKKIRKPDENTIEFFKWFLRPDKRPFMKKKYDLKMELGLIFKDTADMFESQLLNFETVLKDSFLAYGTLISKEEIQLTNIADVVVYIYACTAALARANNSYCFDLPQYEIDVDLVRTFVDFASHEISYLSFQIKNFMHLNEVVRILGESTFNEKQYPAAHPLIKTY